MPCLRGRGNTSDSLDIAESYAKLGLIDPLQNLRNKRHYIFHGTRDAFIHFGEFLVDFCLLQQLLCVRDLLPRRQTQSVQVFEFKMTYSM
jgi:hypothetical protein